MSILCFPRNNSVSRKPWRIYFNRRVKLDLPGWKLFLFRENLVSGMAWTIVAGACDLLAHLSGKHPRLSTQRNPRYGKFECTQQLVASPLGSLECEAPCSFPQDEVLVRQRRVYATVAGTRLSEVPWRRGSGSNVRRRNDVTQKWCCKEIDVCTLFYCCSLPSFWLVLFHGRKIHCKYVSCEFDKVRVDTHLCKLFCLGFFVFPFSLSCPHIMDKR